MITLELAQEFLYDKRTKILLQGKGNIHWVEDYNVKSIHIRSDFGYDEWIFICEYSDCDLIQSTRVSTPKSKFDDWLKERREKCIHIQKKLIQKYL
jgi:hypothetical protein